MRQNPEMERTRKYREFKRMPEVKVGDLIHYHYRFLSMGMSQQARSTKEVIEVINGGAQFVVEGGFRINATQIDTHIPMHREGEPTDVAREAAIK